MTYIEAQFFKVAPFPLNEENQADHKNGQLSIQINSIRGETHWMNITPEQARQIEKLLTQGE